MHSRKVCGGIKNGSELVIKSIFKYFDENVIELFQPFLNKNTTLIPVPRSSLLVEDAVWPSFEIAKVLFDQGMGREVKTLLKRTVAIRKSSAQYTADQRASVQEHMNSLEVALQIDAPSEITLIDDVLTLGRTSVACAIKLNEVYPELDIRLFSIFRTKGLIPDIEKLVDPSVGEIEYYPGSGKTYRRD